MATPSTSIACERHPPERRTRRPVTAHCGCCCCCCCCLHTVGGLIGAAVGSASGAAAPPAWYEDDVARAAAAPPAARGSTSVKSAGGDVTGEPSRPTALRPEIDEDNFDIRRPSQLSAAALFWYISLVAGALGLLYAIAAGGGSGLLVGVVILLLVFPAVQLGAAVIALGVVLFSGRSDSGHQMRQLGKITLGLVIGTLLGVGVMFLLFAGFR